MFPLLQRSDAARVHAPFQIFWTPLKREVQNGNEYDVYTLCDILYGNISKLSRCCICNLVKDVPDKLYPGKSARYAHGHKAHCTTRNTLIQNNYCVAYV